MPPNSNVVKFQETFIQRKMIVLCFGLKITWNMSRILQYLNYLSVILLYYDITTRYKMNVYRQSKRTSTFQYKLYAIIQPV